MSTIDKQRIAAVTKLETMGFTFDGNEWQPPQDIQMPNTGPWADADALHAQLVHRADALAGCIEGSLEEAVRLALTEAIDGYESVRWPDGKEPNGKG